jgi:triacylglycerol lipase
MIRMRYVPDHVGRHRTREEGWPDMTAVEVVPSLPRPVRPAMSPIWREIRSAGALLAGSGPDAGTNWPGPPGGRPVLLVRGFLAGDRALDVLAAHLAAVGHRPHPSGIARNVDCSERTVAGMVDRLERIAADCGGPVAIVGHSRGGLLARVAANRRPELVSGIVALGTPQRDPFAVHPLLLLHGAALGAAAALGLRGLLSYSCSLGRCCARFRAELARPLPAGVGYLSVYSRRDGVVDWRACLDPSGRHVEVGSTHCGMPADRVVVDAVARGLDRFAR